MGITVSQYSLLSLICKYSAIAAFNSAFILQIPISVSDAVG
jgi:hypothetical protein